MTACGCASEHRVVETITGEHFTGGTSVFYVTVRRNSRSALLLGPFDTHDEALERVELGRRLAFEVDSFTAFDSFGTAKVTGSDHKPGLLNELAEKGAT
jgi:hypothetical protein